MRAFPILAAIAAFCPLPAVANVVPSAAPTSSAPTITPQPVPANALAISQQPIVPMQAPSNVSYLPAGYDIIVTPLDGITSKGHEVGSTFSIKTVYDVLYNGYVIIPHGTLGQARISWRTGKGVFGKSAKIELTFDWLDLNGRRIALGGAYKHNGQGNTGATVATTVGVGVATLGLGLLIGGAVTGKSAIIQPGVQMTAHTMEALPIALPVNAPMNAIQAIAPSQPISVPATIASTQTSAPSPSNAPNVNATPTPPPYKP